MEDGSCCAGIGITINYGRRVIYGRQAGRPVVKRQPVSSIVICSHIRSKKEKNNGIKGIEAAASLSHHQLARRTYP